MTARSANATPLREAPETPRDLAGRQASRQRRLVASLVLGCMVAGLAVQLFVPPGPGALVATSVGFGLLLTAAGLLVRHRRRELLDALAGFRLAAAVLAALSGAAALGTLVLQHKPPELYVEQYGALARPIGALGLHDLFHTPWFGALLGLLIASLILSAVRRLPIRATNLGFFAVHLGILVCLAGAGLSALFAVRGRIDLNVDGALASTVRETVNGVPTGNVIDLGASVALAQFDVERHERKHRLVLYMPDKKAQGSLQVKTTFEIDPGVSRVLPGGGRLKVLAWHPERDLAPESDAAPTHQLLQGDGPPQPIAVGQTLTLPDGARVKAVQFFPHFTFDIESRTATSIDDQPVNPALEIELNGERRFLFAKRMGHMGGAGGLRYQYTAPKTREPAAVDLELVRAGAAPLKLRLADDSEQSIPVAEESLLTLELRGDEVKSFKSQVVVTTSDGEGRSAEISVNNPLKVGAWSLYQVNYDPEDPSYSGLEAARDPGVTWVFTGFGLIFFGVFYVFYAQQRVKRRGAN